MSRPPLALSPICSVADLYPTSKERLVNPQVTIIIVKIDQNIFVIMATDSLFSIVSSYIYYNLQVSWDTHYCFTLTTQQGHIIKTNNSHHHVVSMQQCTCDHTQPYHVIISWFFSTPSINRTHPPGFVEDLHEYCVRLGGICSLSQD